MKTVYSPREIQHGCCRQIRRRPKIHHDFVGDGTVYEKRRTAASCLTAPASRAQKVFKIKLLHVLRACGRKRNHPRAYFHQRNNPGTDKLSYMPCWQSSSTRYSHVWESGAQMLPWKAFARLLGQTSQFLRRARTNQLEAEGTGKTKRETPIYADECPSQDSNS